MKRFRLDDSRISDPTVETGAQTFKPEDTKGDGDMYLEHADFSKSLKNAEKDPEEEKYEWREVVRG